jgi:hypothetical protein
MSETNTIKQKNKITDEIIFNKIYFIKNQKVMLDSDLAELYDVSTKRLNEQVKRNLDRFPKDFMFPLSENEWESLRSQIATSKTGRGGRTYLPNVFTEHGVLMLSSILNSQQAIQVNIQIMRIFTRMRQMFSDNTAVQLNIAEIKEAIHKIIKKQDGHDKNIDLLFGYIDKLQEKEEEPKAIDRKKVGFKDWEK